MSYVLGVDPSIAATGVATRYHCAELRTKHLQAPGRELHTLLRRRYIRRRITDRWLTGIRLAVLEGMYPKMQSGQHDRAALLGDLVDVIDAREIPVLIVPPTTLKKYATGFGNADKRLMIEAALRCQLGAPATDNEADALWLCALGHQVAGDPLVHLPADQLAALNVLDDDSWVRGRPNALD